MNAPAMLLGALLVIAGVLASALADRIRGLRIERARAPRAAEVVSKKTDDQITEKVPGVATNAGEGAAQLARGREVVAALIASGYKKSDANTATWGVGGSSRATIESWTKSALQNAGRITP